MPSTATWKAPSYRSSANVVNVDEIDVGVQVRIAASLSWKPLASKQLEDVPQAVTWCESDSESAGFTTEVLAAKNQAYTLSFGVLVPPNSGVEEPVALEGVKPIQLARAVPGPASDPSPTTPATAVPR